MNGDEEIFCDDASRLAMMERVFKGRLLPLVTIFTACLLPQFFLSMFIYHNIFLIIFLGTIIGVYLGCFTAFGILYAKYKKNIRK